MQVPSFKACSWKKSLLEFTIRKITKQNFFQDLRFDVVTRIFILLAWCVFYIERIFCLANAALWAKNPKNIHKLQIFTILKYLYIGPEIRKVIQKVELSSRTFFEFLFLCATRHCWPSYPRVKECLTRSCI